MGWGVVAQLAACCLWLVAFAFFPVERWERRGCACACCLGPLPLGCQAPCELRIARRSDFSSPVAPGGGSVAFWLLWAAWEASSPPDDPALGLGGCPGAERGLGKLVDVP